jgi:hypothetical protein
MAPRPTLRCCRRAGDRARRFAEALLDVAVQYTFPASDPIAVENAYARRRRKKK